MPMIVGEIGNDWDQNGEGNLFEVFQNIQKKFIFKKTHSSISHLEMRRGNTSYYSLKNRRNKRF